MPEQFRWPPAGPLLLPPVCAWCMVLERGRGVDSMSGSQGASAREAKLPFCSEALHPWTHPPAHRADESQGSGFFPLSQSPNLRFLPAWGYCPHPSPQSCFCLIQRRVTGDRDGPPKTAVILELQREIPLTLPPSPTSCRPTTSCQTPLSHVPLYLPPSLWRNFCLP